jgi:hypothetical protein
MILNARMLMMLMLTRVLAKTVSYRIVCRFYQTIQ